MVWNYTPLKVCNCSNLIWYKYISFYCNDSPIERIFPVRDTSSNRWTRTWIRSILYWCNYKRPTYMGNTLWGIFDSDSLLISKNCKQTTCSTCLE